MRMEQLLDKNQQVQLSILHHLVLSGGRLSANVLAEAIHLSKSSLDQYSQELSYLGKELNMGFSLTKEGTTLVLVLERRTTLEGITAMMVRDSFKFQLLEYMLLHRTFTIPQITQEFATSESSVFRKFRELNEVLAEFHIRIKNGRLQGEELQIRYFYFQIYSYFPVRMRPRFLVASDQNQLFFRGLERALETEFSAEAKSEIACWLGISLKRMSAKKTQQTRLKTTYRLFQKDALFQRIEPLIRLYNSRSSFELNQYEPMIFYSFLVSFAILDEETFYRYELQRSKKLLPALLDMYIREMILVHYRPRRLSIQQEKAVGYQLSQINNRIYFFQGYLPRYEPERLLARQREKLGIERSRLLDMLQETARNFLEPAKAQDTLLTQALLIDYASILSMIDFYIAKEVIVGIDLEALPVYRISYYHYLFSELRPIPGIQVEQLREGTTYDLIVSTRDGEDPSEAIHYCLSEFESAYDLDQIKQLIEQLKKAKN
ncbi:helix-turn-helix domain-containing protein [Enterococcus gilvus]|uniref:helix-turn-helix domain-containing protein n=1 Tax=Enterococcus gilvus TaxID=160453 RepID=UPI002907979E|nr:helix-turn-helix domain-containing protein [Enterococcus gilvus]MDU5510841.1 helix-turn-helix domain-containing protein [Enterococcus gilvus]